MNAMNTLTQRNHDFAETRFDASLKMMPSLRTLIVSCIDPRVDPAHLLGLEPGEALVIRNIGGRITPATLETMGILQAISQVQGVNPDVRFNLIVLHHTDCGITRLAGKPELLAAHFGIDPAELPAKAISNPHAAVIVDVAVLQANPALRRGWEISGMVYDVATGLVETVVPPEAVE